MTTRRPHQNNSPISGVKLLTAVEAAALLSVSPKTLADWRSQGRGPLFIQIGRSIRYRAADIKTFIAENTIEPSTIGQKPPSSVSTGEKRQPGKTFSLEGPYRAKLPESSKIKRKRRKKRLPA